MEWAYINDSGNGGSHEPWDNKTFLMVASPTTATIMAIGNMSHSLDNAEDWFGYGMKQINIYVIPFIVLIGIVTNLLSFCVFVMTHLRLLSSSVYLATLALSDSGFLFALFLTWFSWIKIHLVHRPFWCQLIIYLTYACSFVSVYSVVGFTCERFVAVLYPLHRKRLCTRKHALIVVVGITIVGLIMYSYSIWTTTIVNDTGGKICRPRDKFIPFINVMMNTDTVLTLFIPSIVIIALNVRIGYTVYKVIILRNTLHESVRTTRATSGQSESSSGHNNPHKNIRPQKPTKDETASTSQLQRNLSNNSSKMTSSSQIRTTRMLLLVSTVFVLLNLPSHAFRIHAFVIQLQQKQYSTSLQTRHWQEVCTLIYYCNFATNFFLYSISARSFREALMRLVKRFNNKCQKILSCLTACLCCHTTNNRRESNGSGFVKFVAPAQPGGNAIVKVYNKRLYVAN